MPSCTLCGCSTEPLRDSHIFPDFYIERMKYKKVTGDAGQEQPFLILKSSDPNKKDGAKQGREWERLVGLKEKLLCGKCETQFSVYENYARTLLYGNGPQPIKKQPLGTSISPAAQKNNLLLDVRKVTGLDYRLLKLYQLSIIWRASVATGTFFRNVSLGDRHNGCLRDLLAKQDPGPAERYCCSMLDLQYKGGGCEDFTYEPEKDRDEESGQRIYKIILGGNMYVFHIANEPSPELIRSLSINTQGEMVMLSGNAENILSSWSKTLGKR